MTHKQILEKVANEHGVKAQVVEDLVDYMWHLVIRCFNDERLPMLKLPGIGTFVVKPTKLKRLLNAMERPDYKWRDKDDFEEYKVRIRNIYERRLVEEYGRFPNRYVPQSIREDVEEIRKRCQ